VSRLNYSKDFKKSAVEKMMSRGSRTIDSIIEEIGVASPTLYAWRKEFGRVPNMTKSARPQDRSPEEKLKAISNFDSATEADQGELLRKLGLHREHIEAWRKQIYSALKPPGLGKHAERSERAADQRKIKDLERELHRKDKALAETTALLVLKKKAHLIWGTSEEE
jgi:transposase-like protein